jgi:hypothetical protein
LTELSPETVLWNMLRGALTTRALALVADLRVADALADGSRPVEEVARELGADADTLERLLRGRERDEGQWRALLASAALEPVQIDDGLIEARCR